MPEIQVKDKLITLEELDVALDNKVGVIGVKGNAENSYRQGNVNLTPADLGAVAKAGDTMTGPLRIQDGINNLAPRVVFASNAGGVTGQIQNLLENGRIGFVEYNINNSFYENYVLPVPTTTTGSISYNILTDKNILTSNTISTSYGTVTYYKSLHTCTVVMSLSVLPASGWLTVCNGLPAAAASMYFVVYGGSGPCSVYITPAGQLMFNGQGTQTATAYSFTYVTAT